MREYEFRGKPTENNTTYFSEDDFVYGLLLKDDNKYYICLGVNEHIDRDDYEVYMIEVIPETIGQYTGLKDKNGKKIFEGDIVKWADYTMEIFWGEDIGVGYGFCWRPCGSNNDYQESMTGFIDEYEVIGNICDNPELLEEDK